MSLAGVGAALLGAAPHVMHHAGVLAGATLFAGVGGTLLFGALGLAATTPLLMKMRRRTGSWRLPTAALALFTTLFALSAFVITPALTGAQDDDSPLDGQPPATAPERPDGSHETHHP